MKYLHIAGLVFGLGVAALEACTGIKVVAKNGSIVHGRTWEFERDLEAAFVVVPKEYDFVGTNGIAYRSKYAAMGIIAFNELAILDGVNEVGLSVGTFHFPGYATYAELTDDNRYYALSPIEFPNWILTQCATIEEVRAQLSSVVITATVLEKWGKEPPGLHYIVFDKSGKSLVIEPSQGQLVVYDNKLGVLTNAPSFGWHMNYLRNYAHLNMWKNEGLLLQSNRSLPGDFTASSRFVRASLLSSHTRPKEADAVDHAFHILNHFDIPERTSLICVRDPRALKYYFKTERDPAIRMIDLTQFEGSEAYVKRIRIADTDQVAADISSELE